MSDFIRKHGRPDINCMKNGSQGSCCFLLLNREEVSPEKKGGKKKKSMVFLCWSDDRGDVVAADGVWVTSEDLSGWETAPLPPPASMAPRPWHPDPGTDVLWPRAKSTHCGISLT